MAIRAFAVASILFASGSALAGETPYAAPAYEDQGIMISAEKIWHKAGKVWFKLMVVNKSDKPVMFDKEQIQASVAGGPAQAREKSMFAGASKPGTAAPGMSAPLWVEYKAKDDTVQVTLLLKQGFTKDGKAIALKDYTAAPAK
jgi:hypothetical protein